MPARYDVAIAVVERRGRVLICRRRAGAVLGGLWEFPGGKRRPRESWEACVRRELREELGVRVGALRALGMLRHAYAHGRLRCKVFACRIAARARPRPLGASALRWVAPERLRRYRFPPANRALLKKLAYRLSFR